MKSGSLPRPEEDDYSSAAENLLGIDLSSSHLPSEPIDLDDADLFGEPDAVKTPTASANAPEPEPARSAAPVDADDDFGGDFGVGLDSVQEERPARKVERPARQEERPVRKIEKVEEAVPAPAVAAKKDDSYWDALEGFDWSDDAGAGQSRSAPREERGRDRSPDRSRRRSQSSERSGSSDRSSRRPAESPPSRPQRPTRPVVESFGDEFGGGLDDEPRTSASPPDVSTFELHPSESQARFLDEHDVEPPPESSSVPMKSGESQPRSSHRDDRPRGGSRRPAQRPPRPVESDDFGSGLDETAIFQSDVESGADSGESAPPASEGDFRRGRRRRGGRGRGQDRGRSDEGREQDRGRTDEGRAPAETRRPEPLPPVEDSFGDMLEESHFESQASAEPELTEARFADVPTWSEAIALLVKGRPRTSESGSGRGRSDSSSESSEHSGGERGGGDRGRGRGGRRGGRRRSE